MHDPIDLTPVRREGLAEQVARQLLGLIRSGNLRPGDALPPERELAQQMGVSRPVIREALRALSTFGLLRIQHGGGSTVTAVEPESLIGPLSLCLALSDRDLPHILEARAAVELAVVRNAARNVTDQAVAALRENLRRQRAAQGDVDTCLELTDAFRQTILDACGNPFLVALAKSLEIVARRARLLYIREPNQIRSHLDRHERIVEGLASRDPDRAAAALTEHLDHLRRHATSAPAD